MKKLLIITLLSQLLFCATAEQVETYLDLSNSEEELIEMERQFSLMQQSFRSLESNTSEEAAPYDMELLSIRFREYIQKALSEDEMDEILQNYKNVLLLQFVSSIGDPNWDEKEVEAYLRSVKENPEMKERIALVEKLNRAFNNKESIAIMFDGLIKPLLKSASGGDKLDETYMKKRKEKYIEAMSRESQDETLYATREFSMEELEALLKIAQSKAMGYEVKAVYGGMAYALEEFFLSLANRYDISKHEKR